MVQHGVKWARGAADLVHSSILHRARGVRHVMSMARHVERYRNQALASLAVLVVCLLLAVDAWSSNHSLHIALTHTASLLAMTGTILLAYRWRRALRGAREVDFTTGVADYRLRDFEMRKRSA